MAENKEELQKQIDKTDVMDHLVKAIDIKLLYLINNKGYDPRDAVKILESCLQRWGGMAEKHKSLK